MFQAAEFSSSYSEYLVEEVASFYSYNFIQLVLVSVCTILLCIDNVCTISKCVYNIIA